MGRLGQTGTAPSRGLGPPAPCGPFRLTRGLAEPTVHAGCWGGQASGQESQERGYQPDLSEGRPPVQVPGRPQTARLPPRRPPPAPGPHARRVGSGPGGPPQAPAGAAAWDSRSPFCLQASVRKKKGKGRARVCVQPPPARPVEDPSVAVGVASPRAVSPCCVPRAGPAPGHGPVQSVASASRFPSVSPSVSRISPETCPHLVTVKPAGPSAVTARPALWAAAVAAGQGAGKQRPWCVEGGWPLAVGRATP